ARLRALLRRDHRHHLHRRSAGDASRLDLQPAHEAAAAAGQERGRRLRGPRDGGADPPRPPPDPRRRVAGYAEEWDTLGVSTEEMHMSWHGVGAARVVRTGALWLVGMACPTAGRAQAFDPRCSDRSATGEFPCTISRPVVNRREWVYPNVVFAPKDLVYVSGDGCVQTGGAGATWERYLNPGG